MLLPSKLAPKLGGTWTDIIKTMIEVSVEEYIFFTTTHIKLVNGSSTLFWTNHWVGDAPLKFLFLNLYEISIQENEIVFNMGWHDGFSWP